MDGDGGDERVRASNAAFDSNPDWSPDGSRIAFQSNRDGDFDIWVMNADGTGVEQLTDDPAIDDPAFDSAPAWSPDGSRIAFQSNRDGDFEIYTMPAVGGQATQLTTTMQPIGSPTGSRCTAPTPPSPFCTFPRTRPRLRRRRPGRS